MSIVRLSRFFCIACFTFFFFGAVSSRAAVLMYASDALDSQTIGEASDHTLTFITQTGIDASTDTVTATFSGFDLSSIVTGDIALSHGVVGTENAETIAAAPGAGVWGASISGSVLTLSPPTDAAIGEVVASTTIRVLIGTNAGGANQIVNPATAGNYLVTIGGGFGDAGSMGIAIVDDSGVAVTASYPPPSGGTPGRGGGGSDGIPPMLFNVRASSTSPTSVDILWQTDEPATSVVDFGHTSVYASGTIGDVSLVTSHVIPLTNLIPCSTYVFRARSTDAGGFSSSAPESSFTLSCDVTAPIISSLSADQVTDQSVVIHWSTDEPATSFVEYGTTASYGSTADVVGFVTNHNVPIAGLQPGTTYHARVTSVDASGNSSVSGDIVFTTLPDQTPPSNVLLTAVPGNGFVALLWSNPPDADFAGVRIVRRTGGYPMHPSDGDLVFEGYGVGFIDTSVTNGVTYFYGAFAYDAHGNFASGALASATPLATLPTEPPVIPPVIPPEPPVIPPEPPVVPPVTPPVIPPVVVPAQPTKPAEFGVQIFTLNGLLPLQADRRGEVHVLIDAPITVRATFAESGSTPAFVVVIVDGYTFRLSYRPDHGWYEGSFAISHLGSYPLAVQAIYSDQSVSSIIIPLRSVGYGTVFERTIIGDPTTPIAGAVIRLYHQEAGNWVLWDGTRYGGTNPKRTDRNGQYAFLVPQGLYYAEVEREGYVSTKTDPVFIDTNVFHQTIELTRFPFTPEELLQGQASGVIGIVNAYVRGLGEVIGYELKQFQAWLETRSVQDANTFIVAPVAFVIAIANVAGAISALQFFTYLQYLFTQPFLLLWRRKRRAYGVVYHSITKRPIDLAIVRWIDQATGLVIRTAVTDRDGRYLLHADPGTYRLEVVKDRYEFPSALLRGHQTDGDFLDVYAGGPVTVREPSTIAMNIPLDAVVAVETPRRVLFGHFLRIAQHGVALVGVVMALVAFLITPSVPMMLLVCVQIGVYSLFRRLALPAKPKEWGMIADSDTRQPIIRAIVRLYDQVYDRLLETYVTDGRGRYGFLVGKNVYKVVVQAKGYQDSKIEKIDATKAKETVIRVPIDMDREGGGKVVKS